MILEGFTKAPVLHSFSTELCDLALSRHVHVLLLPPNTTSVVQPLDVGVFGPFKQFLYDELNQLPGNSATIKRDEAITCIIKAFRRAFTEDVIKAAWAKCGLWTGDRIDPEAIPREVRLIYQLAEAEQHDPAAEEGKDASQPRSHLLLLHVPPELRETLKLPRIVEEGARGSKKRLQPMARVICVQLRDEIEQKEREREEKKTGRPPRKRSKKDEEESENEEGSGEEEDGEEGESGEGSGDEDEQQELAEWEPIERDDFVAVVLSEEDAEQLGRGWGIGRALRTPRGASVYLTWYTEEESDRKHDPPSWKPALNSRGNPWKQSVPRASVLCVFASDNPPFDQKGQLKQKALESIEESLEAFLEYVESG